METIPVTALIEKLSLRNGRIVERNARNGEIRCRTVVGRESIELKSIEGRYSQPRIVEVQSIRRFVVFTARKEHPAQQKRRDDKAHISKQ